MAGQPRTAAATASRSTPSTTAGPATLPGYGPAGFPRPRGARFSTGGTSSVMTRAKACHPVVGARQVEVIDVDVDLHDLQACIRSTACLTLRWMLRPRSAMLTPYSTTMSRSIAAWLSPTSTPTPWATLGPLAARDPLPDRAVARGWWIRPWRARR